MDSVRNPSQYKTGIASEIADLKARQALVLDYDDWLLARIDEENFLDEIRHMRAYSGPTWGPIPVQSGD